MLTWAVVYLTTKVTNMPPILLLAAMFCDVAIFWMIAVAFAGWPK